jgi:hypothetical protein
MDTFLRKFRDRLRIIIILYTFCDRVTNEEDDIYGVFHSEIKIQALDFLLRYPDFLSMELMDLIDTDQNVDQDEIRDIVELIYQNNEPELRVEEMEKFFHGAYESIDDVIAFHVSIGFLKHDSKKRIDGKKYDKNYYITNECANRVSNHLKGIQVVNWHFERCELIKRYFNKFSGTELKTRQYRYSEYSDISYKSYISNINEKVKHAFTQRFNKQLI